MSFIVRYFVDYFVEIIGLCCDKFSVTNLDTLLLDILLLCFLKVRIIYETKVVIMKLAKVSSMFWAFLLVPGVNLERFL